MLLQLGGEFRTARRIAGLTLEVAGRQAGISSSELSRVERGQAPWVDLPTLGRIASIVGLDLWVRVYPGGDPLRDAGHAALFEAVRSQCAPALEVRGEVPIGDGRDRRAWDMVVTDRSGGRCGMELDTRLLDAQAQSRRIALKRRDDVVDRVLWVLIDTRANRAAVDAARGFLSTSFELDGDRTALDALRRGRLPERDSLLLVRVGRRRDGEGGR